MSADIIPFPPRQPRQVPESDNRARLRTALARLDEANRRQKDAVASWRKALADLRTSMQQLDHSMQRYSLRLATLKAGVDGVHDQARQLERRADAAMRRD